MTDVAVGTMTLPPVVFGQLSRPSGCSSLRSRSAISMTNAGYEWHSVFDFLVDRRFPELSVRTAVPEYL